MKKYNLNLTDEYVKKHIDLFIRTLTDDYISAKELFGEDSKTTRQDREQLIEVLSKYTLECKEIMKDYLTSCHDLVEGNIEKIYRGSKNLLELFKDLECD